MTWKIELQEIFTESQHLLDSTISAQQRAFIVYMANTTRHLLEQLAPLPTTEDAYRQVIPGIGEDFHKSLLVLYGYARMLIDEPNKFGVSGLRPDQLRRLQRIYDLSLGLAQRAQRYVEEQQEEAHKQRHAPAGVVDLSLLLRQEEPLWRYWLRNSHVHLQLSGMDEGLLTLANGYHLRQLLRHICLTMAQELVLQGYVRLEVRQAPHRMLSILYSSPDLEWTTDALATLFMRQGRDVYSAYLTRYGGRWGIEADDRQSGHVLIISLPNAS